MWSPVGPWASGGTGVALFVSTMAPGRSVLICLDRRSAGPEADDPWSARLASWVEALGLEPAVTDDAAEVLDWVSRRAFEASLLDSALVGGGGECVWRTVRPIVGRRLVLMAEAPSPDLWFEALRVGVGAVLPLPPREPVFRAALRAVGVAAPSGPRWARRDGWRGTGSRLPLEHPPLESSDGEDQAAQ